MSNPPTIQTNPLDPVFSGVPVVISQENLVSPTWNKWFVDLREKVNVINSTLAAWSGITPVTGLTPGTYGDATHYPKVTVNEFGLITAVATQSISGGGGGGDPFAVAGGTADTIIATFTPPITALADGDEYKVRASGANTTTAPTFDPGTGALTLYKLGGVALAAGDISGAGHELIVRYRASPARYELVNPAGVQTPQAGAGVAVDLTNPRKPIFSSTLGSLSVDVWVDTYADLPATPAAGKVTYGTLDTAMAYGWNGASWPASSNGIPVGNSIASEHASRVAIQGAIQSTFVLSGDTAFYWDFSDPLTYATAGGSAATGLAPTPYIKDAFTGLLLASSVGITYPRRDETTLRLFADFSAAGFGTTSVPNFSTVWGGNHAKTVVVRYVDQSTSGAPTPFFMGSQSSGGAFALGASYSANVFGGFQWESDAQASPARRNAYIIGACAKSGSTLTSYVNGSQIAQNTSASANVTTNFIGIGGSNGATSLAVTGRFSGVFVINRALTPTELAALGPML